MAERITKINRLEKSKEQLKLESLNEVTDALVFLLGDLEVKDLSAFLAKVNKGLHVANQASPNAKTSIRHLLGVLKDDDMNRSLTYMINLLKGMSKE